MRISAIFMPFFALAAGAAGFYLRLMELWDVFDPLTGLPARGATTTYALFALSVVVLIVVLVFSIRVAVKHKSPRGFENAFGTDPLPYPIVISVIGMVWLGATVYLFLDKYASGDMPMSDLYFLILSALTAISIAFFAIEMYQNPRRKTTFALSIVPTIFMCFWLIIVYRQNASNPILLSYGYHSLAIITSALGFYFSSGFVYSKPAPGRTIFVYFVAIYFCFVTLADEHSISIRLIIGAIIVMNTIYSSMLIKNLRWKGQ